MKVLAPPSILLWALLAPANAFNGMTMSASKTSTTPSSLHVNAPLTRRSSFAAAITPFVAASFPLASIAVVDEETPRTVSRMGGLLEKYADPMRGWSIFCPSGWNKFEGEVGAYDVKWQDVVDPAENIKISSNPVKSTTTSIAALGEVKEVGAKLAASRKAKLINAEERLTEGILFYTFEFALDEGTHQLLSLSVNKGKIWSLDCNTKEKRWEKRKDLYYNVAGSFIPKLV